MVLIDMEMPKNCYECMLVGEGGDCLLSYMTNTDVCCNFSLKASRPNNCPMKNVEINLKSHFSQFSQFSQTQQNNNLNCKNIISM